MTPSNHLVVDLAEAEQMQLRTEKAKSEWIVVPILRELKRRNADFFTIYSGENLDVDPAIGLNGECDFILTKDTKSFSVSYPVFQIVEAKKHDFDLGVPQCAAQLVGAKQYNEMMGTPVDRLYGCVTTGVLWQFMVLDDILQIDPHLYPLANLEELLGILQTIISHYAE